MPGNYCLVGNHTVNVISGNSIEIAANNVTLDCGGHTITNTTSSSDPLYAAINATDVQVTTLDNEMVLTLPSAGAAWGTGMPAIGIDGRAIVVDPHTADYDNATLTVALTTNATADDRLEIRNTGTGPGQISVSGDTVSYEGIDIATFSGGAAAQALLRSVTFRSVSAEPSLALRSVTVSFARIDGAIASTTTTVRVGLLRVSDFQEGADHGHGIYTGAADIELPGAQQMRRGSPDGASSSDPAGLHDRGRCRRRPPQGAARG